MEAVNKLLKTCGEVHKYLTKYGSYNYQAEMLADELLLSIIQVKYDMDKQDNNIVLNKGE